MRLENLPSIDIEEENARAQGRESGSIGSVVPGTARHAAHAAGGEAPWESEMEPTPLPLFGEETPAPRHQRGRAKYVLAAACAVVLVGAGAAFAVGSGMFDKPEEPEVPVVAAPTTVQATVKADNVVVAYRELSRGDVLTNVQLADELTGAYEGQCYKAELDGKTVYVEKKYVRTSEEAAPEEWVGYAAENAIIFANPDFSGDDILTLVLNEEVTVLDSFNDVLFVRNADGYEGYMPADKVLREPVAEEEAEEVSTYSYSYSYSYSYNEGGSGSSDSGNSGNSGNEGNVDNSPNDTVIPAPSTGGSTSEDGDEVPLPTSGSFFPDAFLLGARVAYADELADDASGTSAEDTLEGMTATVLMDGTPTYLAILNRGDEVTVKIDDLFDFDGAQDDAAAQEGESELLSQEERDLAAASGEQADDVENLCTVLVNDAEVQLPERLLSLETGEEYEQWVCYAAEGAMLYSDYQLTSGETTLELNQELTVIDEIGGSVLVVELDGQVRYLSAALVAKEAFDEPEPEAEEEEEEEAASEERVSSYSYSTPQYSSGGSSYSGPSDSGSISSPDASAPNNGGGGDASANAPETSGGSSSSEEEELWTPTQK